VHPPLTSDGNASRGRRTTGATLLSGFLPLPSSLQMYCFFLRQVAARWAHQGDGETNLHGGDPCVPSARVPSGVGDGGEEGERQ
jgi:hypothetical protein